MAAEAAASLGAPTPVETLEASGAAKGAPTPVETQEKEQMATSGTAMSAEEAVTAPDLPPPHLPAVPHLHLPRPHLPPALRAAAFCTAPNRHRTEPGETQMHVSESGQLASDPD